MPEATDRRTFIKLSGMGAASFAAAGVLPLHAAAVPDVGRGTAGTASDPVTDLGEPVFKTQALSSAIGNGPDGEPLAYFLIQGNPTTTGEFAVVDLRTKQTVLDIRVPVGASSQRTMAVSPVNGDVYVGTADTGDLYRYRPGADDVEHLGRPLDGQRIWGVGVGDDGTVWGGTYPGGRLFSVDPESGAVTDHGQALPGEQYIGAIEQVGDVLYVGTQPNGRLATFDLVSSGFTEVQLPDGPVSSKINKIDLRGDRLFVATGSYVYVRDVATGTWMDEIPGASGYGVSPLDPETGNVVYVRSGGQIKGYHVDSGELESIGWAPNASPEWWAWVDLADPDMPGLSVALTYWRARIYARNPQTGSGYYHQAELMGAGAPLVSIGAGPEGDIYAGAYLSPPGMGHWNPDAGEFELLNGTSQIEGFGIFDGDLVFGRYPQGRLYRYDLDQPWDMGTNPGPTVELDEYEQNRCQSFVQVGDLMAVASVPVTGRHNGAVTLWDPDTNDVEVFRGVVENQTPVSLVLHDDGLLYGGTSINGGYGIDPVTPEAKLFAWDPAARETVFETVPVPGAPTVSGLVVDESGRLWGLAGGTLFEFDPAERVVVRRFVLFDEPDGSRYGNDHVLLLDHGRLFGVTLNRLFVFDWVTGEHEVLYDATATGADTVVDARHLAMDRYGDLYFIGLSTHLMRYNLPDDTEPPTVRAELRPRASVAADGRRVVRLSADDSGTGVAAIQYRLDGGTWTRYRRTLVVEGEGEHEVEFRAVDHAWNASPVQRVAFTIGR